MRPLRLIAGWLLGAAVYAVAGLTLLVGAVVVAAAAGGAALTTLEDPGAGFGGAMVAAAALVVLAPVVAGALAGLAACGLYRWHTGMSWWKWGVVALGGPALLWLVLAAAGQATTGLGTQLEVNGRDLSSPVLGALLVVLALGAPVATGILVGRIKNRRAAALQEAVWPGSASQVTRAGRDVVAVAATAVVGVLLVGTGAVAAADGYERVEAGSVTVDVPDTTTNLPSFEILSRSDDVVTFQY